MDGKTSYPIFDLSNTKNMTTVKHHLAKQLGNGKETSKVNQCGRGYGVQGSIRVLSISRFLELVKEEPTHCCEQCLKAAQKRKLL